MKMTFSDSPNAPTHFGTGWISGTLAIAAGILGLGGVLCLRFPSLLVTAETRSLYPLPIVRGLIYFFLIAAFTMGVISLCLRRNKALGLVAVVLAGGATALGGAQTPVPANISEGSFLGLDWFLLNLIFWSAICIPMERLYARRRQPVFRSSWRTDLSYFFITNLLVDFTTLATLRPALVLFSWSAYPPLQNAVRHQPIWVQFIEILIVADFVQYWVHRAFHQVPLLWRFHAVHHSTEEMDWLAGSRLHILDQIVTHSLVFVPVFVMGFGMPAMVAYVAVISLQATFIHANVRWTFPGLREFLVTPQFHHWHHAADVNAIDTNFAVHLPALDRIFGTYYMPPDCWPDAYGIEGRPVPRGFLKQLIYPFQRPKSAVDESPTPQ